MAGADGSTEPWRPPLTLPLVLTLKLYINYPQPPPPHVNPVCHEGCSGATILQESSSSRRRMQPCPMHSS